MTSMVAQLRISLGLDSAAFDTGMRNASQKVNALGINMGAAQASFARFDQGLVQAGQSAIRTGNQLQQVRDRSGQMQAGLQQLGFQLQDITVQFASGGKAGTIFAQQLPQVFGALSMVAEATGKSSGLLGSLAGFLSGPWGVAVGVGAAVLPMLISKIFATGEAASKAEDKVDSFAQSLQKLRTAPMEVIGAMDVRARAAESNLRRAQAMPRYTGGGSAEYVKNTYAERQRAKAIQDAELELQNARSELAVARQTASNIERLSRASAPSGGVDRSGGSHRSGSGGSASAARSEAKTVSDTAASYDRLLSIVSPGRDELDKFKASMADLAKVVEAGAVSPETAKAWEAKLRDAAGIGPDGLTAIKAISGGADDLDAKVAKITDRLGTINLAANDNANKTEAANSRVQDSFETMAQGVIGSLQGLAYSIQSGGFLGIMSGLLDLGLQLGGIGAFGKSVQANIKAMPAHADGTMFSAGGLAMVGERGPEIVNLPRGSRVWKHGTGPGGGGGNTYNFRGNLMTPEFFEQIQRGNVAAAQAGGELGYRKVARAGMRRLGA